MGSCMKKLHNLDYNTLVRYRTISENNLNALKENRLYYSTPANFNDPYDTLLYADYGKIMQDVYGNLENGMDKYLLKLKDNKEIKNAPIIAGIGYAFWNGTKKDEFIDNFLGDVLEAASGIKIALRKNVKIICFTEEHSSMLMWSHYADNHKGFALIYDKDDIGNADNYMSDGTLIRKKPILKKVMYTEQQTDLTEELESYVRAYRMETLGDVKLPETNLSQDKLRNMILEKSPDWKYEKEWRVIPRHISLEQESNLAYMKIKPKAVILGSMCSEADRRKLIDICNKKRIPVFQSTLKFWEPGYKLSVSDLDESFKL